MAFKRLGILVALLCVNIPVVHGFVQDIYDGYSMPEIYHPKGFEMISTIVIAADPVGRAEQFNVNHLESAEKDGLKWVRWRVNRKKNVTAMPLLGFKYPSRINPEKYELLVFNNGKVDVDLPVTSLKAGEQKVISVPVHDDGGLNFYLPGVKDETEYEVLFRDLNIHYPMAKGLKVDSIKSPEKLTAGTNVEFTVHCTGQIKDRVLDLELLQDRWVLWRIRLTESERAWLKSQNECVVSRTVPWYIASTDAKMVLASDGYRVSGDEKAVKIVNSHKSELPKMKRRHYNGTPTLFKNGKPYNWTGYATYDYHPGVVKEFGESGAHVFWITVPVGKHLHHVALPIWHGGDNFDFGQIAERISTGLQANPDADFILRLNFALPHSWYTENPDSKVMVRTENGDIPWEETLSTGNSLADENWRQKEVEILNKLIDHIKEQPWAERVIGFMLGTEVTEEWFAWGCNDGQFGDYSPVNERAFQKWLSKTEFDFDRIPDPDIRSLKDYDVFPDTQEGKWAGAYNKYYNELTAETICYFSKALKEATDRRSLAIILYGYVIQLAGEPRQSLSGHFGLRAVLDSEDIDCIMGIPLHSFRMISGIGYDTYTSATESVRLSGKLINNENDLFSWLHPLHWHKPYDPKDPRGAAISMHRRVMANDAVHGSVRQWFSLSPDWHHDEQLQNEFAKQIELFKTTLDYDRTPTEEIAFVVDDTSFYWFTMHTKYPLYSHHKLMNSLAMTGAPLGVWLLSDIDKIPERVKFIAVGYSPAANKGDIEKLKKVIDKGGRTILLVGTTGLVDPANGNWNRNATAEITGLNINLEDGLKPCRAYRTDGTEISNLASWIDIYAPNEVPPVRL